VKPKLIIFGYRGTAIELKELVEQHYSGEFSDVDIWFYDHTLDTRVAAEGAKAELRYILAVADFEMRTACVAHADRLQLIPQTIIHPSAVIFDSATIGQGTYIGANATVSSEAEIAEHCLINLNASVGHHAELNAHTILLPGARISGNVSVGTQTLIGSNAFIYQGRTIGPHNLIDALTYVDKDLPPGHLTTSKRTKTIRRPGFRVPPTP